jgi:hypothetical protein
MCIGQPTNTLPAEVRGWKGVADVLREAKFLLFVLMCRRRAELMGVDLGRWPEACCVVGRQGLLQNQQAFYALVVSPTRELAVQIAECFEALGSGINVRCAVLVGGMDLMDQTVALAKRPHIIVGTPGRVVDHLSNTKVGQSLLGWFCISSQHFSCAGRDRGWEGG